MIFEMIGIIIGDNKNKTLNFSEKANIEYILPDSVGKCSLSKQIL